MKSTTCVFRKEQILAQEVAGTVVLLTLDTGQYYALEAVGARAWELCDGSRTLAAIAARIAREYDAPIGRIEQDLIELFTELTDENLVGENP